MDPYDDHLINGYFRQCNLDRNYIIINKFYGLNSLHLPNDIQGLIASYYTKKYSKTKLIKAIKSKRIFLNKMKYQKEVTRDNRNFIFMVILIFLVMCAADVAAIVVSSLFDCSDPDAAVDINLYLLILPIIHIVLISLLCVIPLCDNECFVMVLSCILIFFVFFGFILGAIDYGGTYDNNNLNQQCKDMLISWIVITFGELCIAWCVIKCADF